MATAPVGITIPKLLPITGTWALPLSIYGFLLSARVSACRVNSDKMIGDKPQSATGESDDLLVANRSHANFCENVPLALLMGAIVEMNGGDRKVLSGSFAALLLFRILHVELGLRSEGARGVGRPLGHFGTVGFTIGMAGYAAYLVKGYWGF